MSAFEGNGGGDLPPDAGRFRGGPDASAPDGGGPSTGSGQTEIFAVARPASRSVTIVIDALIYEIGIDDARQLSRALAGAIEIHDGEATAQKEASARGARR